MAKISFIYFDLTSGHAPGLHHGLASIFGTLKEDKHEVHLSHLIEEIDIENAVNLIKIEHYDICALSFTSNLKKYVHNFLNQLGPSPNKIIAGGAHCTIVKEAVFEEFPLIEGICVGEGELPMKEMCRRIDGNRDILSTPSFFFNTKDQIIKNPIEPLPNIDEIPFPDYSLFDCPGIISQQGLTYTMSLGRGCPYNCSYCSSNEFSEVYPNKGRYVRKPSVEHSLQIIKNNLRFYPEPKKLRFADESFAINKKWLFDFCCKYKKEIGLPFMIDTRFENINDPTAKALKSAGCEVIHFGLETGNEWLRYNILNRNHSNQKIKDVIHIVKMHRIQFFLFNIVGLPFETKEMAKETLNFNIELNPDFGTCHYFIPLPGTHLYKLCKDFDLMNNNLDALSGFFEAPAIKNIFMAHKEMIKYRESMNAFFFTRLLCAKIKIPVLLEKVVMRVSIIFRKPIDLLTLNPSTSMKTLIVLRKILIRLAWRFFR